MNISKIKGRYKVIAIILMLIIYMWILVYISLHQSYYCAEISSEKTDYEFVLIGEGEQAYTIPVTIKNKSNSIISSINGDGVFLSYHLYDQQGKLISFDNTMTSINKGIFCGDKKNVTLNLSELDVGVYTIYVDLYNQKEDKWFSEYNTVPFKIVLTVSEK